MGNYESGVNIAAQSLRWQLIAISDDMREVDFTGNPIIHARTRVGTFPTVSLGGGPPAVGMNENGTP